MDADGLPIGTTGVAMDVTIRERQNAATTEALAQQRVVVDTLQRALLRAVIPRVAGVEVATRYMAADRDAAVGGDWYAVVPVRTGCIGVAIGDVAGHGLAAVADMAAARFSLRALALAGGEPEEVLDQLNRTVRVFAAGTMITALYGILDSAARTWTYATAGHCPVLLRRADGETEWLDAAVDPPLGVASSFRRQTVDVDAGSTLILYTDGLVERRHEPITIGLDRLAHATENGPKAPEALCDHLSETLLGDTAAADDVALVVVTLI